MRYISVCSGIEAATVAWEALGWEAVAFSEIEKFPSQVLQHHYPNVPNLGDMTNFKEWNLNESIDILVGGTPCQSFSVAGLRKGLEDPRGNLMLTYLGILDKFRPKWCVWENVPGVLSSNGGRDFGSFLGALAKLGYGFSYRVLDAQNFGVAQRRRRVFVVGNLGDWRSAAEVLFEPESLRGDSKKSREKREGTSKCLTTGIGTRLDGETDQFVVGALCARDYKGVGNQYVDEGKCIVYENHPADSRVTEMGETCSTVAARWGTGGGNVPFALAENTIGRQPQNGGNGDGFTEGGPMYTLNATGVHGVAVDVYNQSIDGDVAPTLTTANPSRSPQSSEITNQVAAVYGSSSTVQDQQIAVGVDMYNLTTSQESTQTIRGTGHIDHVGGVMQQMAVRRLTPVECERLQGFPDNYTDILPGGKPTPDGPRYKALGNSMAVPVMRWIGKRIKEVECGS